MNVAVLDLGLGNIHSLTSALAYLGAKHVVTADGGSLDSATHVIVPGVGAFDAAMEVIGKSGLSAPLCAYTVDRQMPLLGICLGMQLLFEGSEEGQLPGLALMPGRFGRLASPPGSRRKVPHVGFSSIYGYGPAGLFKELKPEPHFYFTHSYALPNLIGDCNTAVCDHTQPFVAAFQKANVCGVQFHPEKSQSAGLQLISNFLELSGPAP